VAGIVYNVDAELGKDGIIGIKTGFTTQAGGCFVFAATTKVDGRTRTVVGAVLHQENTPTQPSPLTAAFDASTALITSTDQAIEQETVVHAGQVLGHVEAPWAPPVALKATRSVTFTGLAGDHVRTVVDVPATVTPPLAASHRLGSATVELGDQRTQVPLATTGTLPGVSLGWRLTDV
jgi:serine-type D-Ala-D-Ala carboxypeptidase (penicillin-binding protein 5/6)